MNSTAGAVGAVGELRAHHFGISVPDLDAALAQQARLEADRRQATEALAAALAGVGLAGEGQPEVVEDAVVAGSSSLARVVATRGLSTGVSVSV